MCGRIFIEYDIKDIISFYRVEQVNSISTAKGEIYPGTSIPVILKDRTLDFLKWGFQISGMNREVINARIETVLEKPTFKKAFLNNRCIIPSNAFFEWETIEKSKTKYKVEIQDQQLFSMAGIYDSFIDKSGNIYNGVVILTRPSNMEMSKLHHRMPVIIPRDKEEKWLKGSYNEILEMMKTLATEEKIHLNILAAEAIKQMSIYDLL